MKRRWLTLGGLLVAGWVLYAYLNGRSLHIRKVAELGVKVPMALPIQGIDISKYQGQINWDSLRSARFAGLRVHFVFLKATEGTDVEDPRFEENWTQARAHGFIRGAYHYFYSTRDPMVQARHFIHQVKLEPGDLPPVLDMEITNNRPDSQIQRTALIWLNAVEQAYGVRPILYTNPRFYRRHLGSAFKDYPLWISHYHLLEGPVLPQWKFWQYSDSARLPGIQGRVDMDAFSGDSLEFRTLRIPAGLHATKPIP